MTARDDAAPEVSRTSGHGNIDSGDARSIPPKSVPPHILERLAAAGVHSLDAWRALGRRRREIFGVTPRWIRQLDALAREQRP